MMSFPNDDIIFRARIGIGTRTLAQALQDFEKSKNSK